MGGMPQRARDGGVAMYRMYDMTQRAIDGSVEMHRIYGMTHGVAMPQHTTNIHQKIYKTLSYLRIITITL